MAKLSKDLSSGLLHPRESLFASGALGALNSEVTIACDGCASVVVDLRGTFNLSVAVEGSVDGANWTAIPVRPINAALTLYVINIAGSTTGNWTGSVSGFRFVRARVAAYTSGSATCVIAVNLAPLDQSLSGTSTNQIVTTIGTAGVATTLTLPAPGAGLRHYLTHLRISRYATAALVAGAVPGAITTTNLPGALAFTVESEAAAQGVRTPIVNEDFAYPVAASAFNTATTIICPATTSVIWRATAGYFVAP